MTTATATHYATSLMVPTAVRDFFDTLREFGTIKGVNAWANGGITLCLPGEDTTPANAHPGEGSLGARLMRLKQALGSKGIAPAFPARTPSPWGGVAVSTYRWEFDDATYAGDGQWSIVVPVTADLLHLLECVSGLAGYDRDYLGESILPVTYYPEDPTDTARTAKGLREDLRAMEDDLEAWFGEPVRFEEPTPVP